MGTDSRRFRGVPRVAALLALALSAVSAPSAAEIGVEYIGHASFVFTSPSGVRVAIDPFNSDRWLGYRYPESVEADAVLITHPHYDHDASYYFDASVPVFREPGRYQVGDVELLGVEGRHASPYGRDFGQLNTMWRVTTGGVTVAHLGDNGPLTDANVRELGKVDVLFLPADGDDHILTGEQIEALREALGDPVVVPMHYRLPGFHDLPKSLGPVDPWLDRQKGVVRLETNQTTFAASAHGERRVVVLEPSAALTAWPESLVDAWEMLDRARQVIANEPTQTSQAFLMLEQAYASGKSIVFAFHWAQALATEGRTDEAIAVLESALARGAREDWEYRMRSHVALAELLLKRGRAAEANAHYRIVLAGSHRGELRDKAQKALSP